MRSCIRNAVWVLAHIPFYLVAFACCGWFLWRAFDRRQWRELLLAIGAFAIASPLLFVQSLHAYYYYLQLFPAAFLVALWTLRLTPDMGQRGRLLVAMAGVTFAGWAFFTTVDVNEDSYFWLWMKAARHQNASLQKLDRQFHLSQEPEMLFLSAGEDNYILRTKSHLRHIAPAILQRAKFHKALRNTEPFRQTLDDVLAYHGTYIYLSDWFPLDHLPELAAKLKNEYEPATPKIEAFWPLVEVQLLKRKSTAPKPDPSRANARGAASVPKGS